MPTHLVIGKSHVGRMHADNQDEIVTRRITREGMPHEIYLIGIADGISQTPYGGRVARWLMRNHFESDSIFPDSDKGVVSQFEVYLHGLHAQFRKEFETETAMLASGASLSIACLWDDLAVCVWAGDCPIFLTGPNGKKLATSQISIPDAHRVTRQLTDCFGAQMPFDFKKRELSVPEGGILTITSDGAQSDEFTLNDLYQKREAFSPVCIQEVIDSALKYPKCDDVSMVACKRV